MVDAYTLEVIWDFADMYFKSADVTIWYDEMVVTIHIPREEDTSIDLRYLKHICRKLDNFWEELTKYLRSKGEDFKNMDMDIQHIRDDGTSVLIHF